MKIAIHKSSWGFSQDWIAYCERKGIEYKIVSCYDFDIISQLLDCDALMWHHHHSEARDALFAQRLLFALQQSGKKVFPDFNTGWHFDDKVGQKYLLEAIGAPLAPSWVFYEKDKALKWLQSATFPKVFKLRGGAGSSNVKLIKNKSQAVKYVRKAFGRGFPSYDKWGDLNEQIRKFKWQQRSFLALAKSIRRFFVSTHFARTLGRQKGYVLFQEFMPDNKFDIRIVVLKDRAVAMKRFVRENDFRASGSGIVSKDKNEINTRCIQIAFDISNKLNSQSTAFDFVFDNNGIPYIVEISYGFNTKVYPGYWDKHLNWHEGSFNSAEWMVEAIIKK